MAYLKLQHLLEGKVEQVATNLNKFDTITATSV
jgi:hypothetical protein